MQKIIILMVFLIDIHSEQKQTDMQLILSGIIEKEASKIHINEERIQMVKM
jgi:hypothetical protein